MEGMGYYLYTPAIGICCMAAIGAVLLVTTLAILLQIAALVSFSAWILAIIDVIRRDFKDDATKICWLLCIILLQLVGSIVYLIAGRPMGTLSSEYAKQNRQEPPQGA